MHYLFDFDGTLVDSMPTYGAMMLGALARDGIPHDESVLKIITPLGYALTAKYFVEQMGVKRTPEDLVQYFYETATEAYKNRIEAKPHVPEVLRALRARGDSLHVLTASPHPMLDPCLKRIGIFDLFQNVWSCEDFGTGKSDPEIYRMAAARIGVSVGEVTFLDDNYNADKTAAEAGMHVIGVFDKSSAEYEREIRAVSERYIYDFSELL
jgi:HAD superfamily hydrolase (TIGR01509 family)